MINALDHVNLRSSRMKESVDFYTNVLGLVAEPIPGYPDLSEAAWIFTKDRQSVVHINIATDDPDMVGDSRDWSTVVGTGRVHHVALDCSGYEEMRERLVANGLEPRFNDIPQIPLRQIFVHDPNGLLIELNFR